MLALSLIVPRSFLFSSKQDQCRSGESPNKLSHYCSLSALLAFGAVLVVNLAVFELSVTEFHNTGLVILTLQDAQALIEQVFCSPNTVFSYLTNVMKISYQWCEQDPRRPCHV